MLDDLLTRIAKLNIETVNAPADIVLATPEWAKEEEFETIRALLLSHAINLGVNGPTVIPQAAKRLKEVGVDLQVSRDGKTPLSVVAYTAFGNLIVWWEREVLLYWMEIHNTVHPAAREEPLEYNSHLDVPPGKVVVIEGRGFFDRLGDALSILFKR